MIVKIPKDKAIALLEKRIGELHNAGFNYKVWQMQTSGDLVAIFPTREQANTINNISFESQLGMGLQFGVYSLQHGQEEGYRVLKRYIDFINDHVADEVVSEKIAKVKPSELENVNESLRKQVEEYKVTVADLESHKLQLKDITFKGTFTAIGHLPASAIFTFLSFIIALLGIAFYVGVFFVKHGWL